MPSAQSDILLVRRIRSGETEAWNELIARFEGRLLAFVEHRVSDRSVAEDIVQETLIGFLTSLPNYDERRSLESYLYSIAAHKLTDHLRREGRRLALPLTGDLGEASTWDPPSPVRRASSMVRSDERRGLEETALASAVGAILARWKDRGEWVKIRCAELLFVRGAANKDAASQLELSEQTIANYKFEFLAQLRRALSKQGLPDEVFPELYEAEE